MAPSAIVSLGIMIAGAIAAGYLLGAIHYDRSSKPSSRVREPVKGHSRNADFAKWWDDYGHQLDVSYYIAEEIWAAAVENKK